MTEYIVVMTFSNINFETLYFLKLYPIVDKLPFNFWASSNTYLCICFLLLAIERKSVLFLDSGCSAKVGLILEGILTLVLLPIKGAKLLIFLGRKFE